MIQLGLLILWDHNFFDENVPQCAYSIYIGGHLYIRICVAIGLVIMTYGQVVVNLKRMNLKVPCLLHVCLQNTSIGT